MLWAWVVRQKEKTVEDAISQYPDLSNDLRLIGASLETYATIHKVQPSASLKEKILQDARDKGFFNDRLEVKSKSSSWSINTLSLILGALLFGLGIWHLSQKDKYQSIQTEYEMLKSQCDSIRQATDYQYAIIDQLQDPDNRVLPLSATPDYADTQLSLVYNEKRKTNFIQVQNLPNITDQQSFQLWSLKENQAPIPLTVFQGTEGIFIPVDFEDGTATYAITIEPFGGQDAPNLAQLIATVSIAA